MDGKMKRKRRIISLALIVLGVLLFLLALGYFASLKIHAAAAAEKADEALEMLKHQESCEAPIVIPPSLEEPSYFDVSSEEEPEPSESEAEAEASDQEPEYVEHLEMPVVSYEGNDYIGYLDIPALDLQLPVMSDWSYDKLDLSPCRYSGSFLNGDLIIMAHNYSQFFGKLKNLSPGDTVYFTDGDQETFTYAVTAVEQLDPDDLEALNAGDWDMSLFTCTVGGRKRVTVRLSLMQ
jgi:sortase A